MGRNSRCAPVPMETNAYLADWGPQGLTLWLATQGDEEGQTVLLAALENDAASPEKLQPCPIKPLPL